MLALIARWLRALAERLDPEPTPTWTTSQATTGTTGTVVHVRWL